MLVLMTNLQGMKDTEEYDTGERVQACNQLNPDCGKLNNSRPGLLNNREKKKGGEKKRKTYKDLRSTLTHCNV